MLIKFINTQYRFSCLYLGLFTNYVSNQRGGGSWQMLTLAEKGGRGGLANADIGRQRGGEGGVAG